MICTPDKTGRCTTCGDMLSTGQTDADLKPRTGSKTVVSELKRTKAEVESLLQAEITAHERTKAELAEARKIADEVSDVGAEKDRSYYRVCKERDAAQAELQRYKDAVAAQFRYDMAAIIDGTPERRIAARVTLLERMVRIMCRPGCSHDGDCAYGRGRATEEEWEQLSAKLAALDAAQPTSKEGDDGK